jgi:hypothetical protein
MSRLMSRPIALLLSSCLASGAAAAAGGELASPFGQAYSVAPERHVVEIVKVSGNGSLRFVINGHAFTAASGACGGWTTGDRVSLTAGEWHGYCATAVFRNVTRRRSCEVLCNGW